MASEETNLAIALLEAAGVAGAAGECLALEDLARGHGASTSSLELEIERLEQMGLLLSGLDEGDTPMLLEAGRQYLKRQGDIPREVLRFLPRTIHDLHAREALIHAGTTLVDEFRHQLLRGDAVDHAAQLVPPAFAQAVDQGLALDFFAATVALMARLSDGKPAGCVAEEIVAVSLVEDAKAHLDMRYEMQELTEDEVASAAQEIGGLFDLFEDDDVLDLFEMSEPSDAALAGHDPLKQELGVVDQRIEAWFEPFSWTIPTGYLGA
jgi:hypothetical protein